MLSVAAGAMIYVIVEELRPDVSEGVDTHIGAIAFTLGFTVMMAMDVALG
jgi:ZIP family zinc transporter